MPSLNFTSPHLTLSPHLTPRKQFSYAGPAIDRIHLITMPRWFGYAFNPVNFYFCYCHSHHLGGGGGGDLVGVLLEVHNTFGETHLYWLDASIQSERRGYVFGWFVGVAWR